MTENYCENCIWCEDCVEKEEECPHFTPASEDDDIDLYNKTEYENEWQNYKTHWAGNDKWGDDYDR